MDLINEFEEHQQKLHLAKAQLEACEAHEFGWLKAMIESWLCFKNQGNDHSCRRIDINEKGSRKREECSYFCMGGEREGYTLQSTMELQGKKGQVLGVDIKRGQDHDMASSLAYKALLSGLGWSSTRSHWRPKLPLAARAWEHEWRVCLTLPTPELCQDDDILMWRQIFLYLVADFVRRAKERGREENEEKLKPERTLFLLEQPADPVEYMPECVLFLEDKRVESIEGCCQFGPRLGQARGLHTMEGWGTCQAYRVGHEHEAPLTR